MVLFYHGKNSFLSLKKAREDYHKFLKENPEYSSIEIDGQSSDPELIIQNVQTHEMFSDGKVIFFKRLYSRKDKEEVLEVLMEVLEEDKEGHNIIIWEEKKVPANTRYVKYMKKNFEVYESPDLNKRTFMTWARSEVDERGMKIDPDAIKELANRSNFDAERFLNDLRKIEILGIEEVSIDTIKRVSTDTYEYDIWNLIDSINKNDKPETMRILNSLLSQNIDPHYILAMIFRNSRLLVLTNYLLKQGEDNRGIASKLKLPPFTVPSIIKSVNSTNEDSLKRLYQRLTNLDYQIKTGQIDATLGVTLLGTVL